MKYCIEMILDEDEFIEAETRRNFKILLEEQQKLTTVVLMLVGLNVLVNTYLFSIVSRFNIDRWLSVNLIYVLLPAILGLILTLFFNIIPYKQFNYGERFIRTYLILLMIFYILILINSLIHL